MQIRSENSNNNRLFHRSLLTERESPRLRFWQREAGSRTLQEEDGFLSMLVRIIAFFYPEFYTKYEEISFYPLRCVDRLSFYSGQVSEVAGGCHQQGPRHRSTSIALDKPISLSQ